MCSPTGIAWGCKICEKLRMFLCVIMFVSALLSGENYVNVLIIVVNSSYKFWRQEDGIIEGIIEICKMTGHCQRGAW